MARDHDPLGLAFESAEDDDFRLELVDRFRGRGVVDQGFFEVFLFRGVQIVGVLGDVGQLFRQRLAAVATGREFAEPAMPFTAMPAYDMTKCVPARCGVDRFRWRLAQPRVYTSGRNRRPSSAG